MTGDIHTFPVAAARRRAMIFNLCAYPIGAASALWLWHDGAGWGWGIFGVIAAVLTVHVAAVLILRRDVARLTPDGVEAIGLWGKVTRLPWEDLTAHTIEPDRRAGVVFAAPRTPGGKERFAIISLRMMGAEQAARFFQLLMARRPGLEKRRDPVDEARNPSPKGENKAGVTAARGKAPE